MSEELTPDQQAVLRLAKENGWPASVAVAMTVETGLRARETEAATSIEAARYEAARLGSLRLLRGLIALARKTHPDSDLARMVA
jgi:hypothetical protein